MDSMKYVLNGNYTFFYFNESEEDRMKYEYIFSHHKEKTTLERLEQFLLYTRDKYDIDLWFDSNGILDTDEIQTLFPHAKEDLYIVVPSGQKISEFLYIFLIFTPNVWLCLILETILTGCLLAIFYNYEHTLYAAEWELYSIDRILRDIRNRVTRNTLVPIRRRSKISITYGILNTYKMLLMNPINLYQNSHSATRVIILAWYVVYIILNSAIVSSLLTILFITKYHPDCDTFRDLEQHSMYQLFAFETTMELFQEVWNTSQIIHTTGNKKAWITPVNSFLTHLVPFNYLNTQDLYKSMCLKSHQLQNLIFSGFILSQSDAYRFIILCEFNYSKSIYNDPDLTFHVMNESPMPRLNSFNVPKGSIYLQLLYDSILWTIESGLSDRWEQNKESVVSKYTKGETQSGIFGQGGQAHERLTLMHLQSAFYFIIIGWVFGFIVFLGEFFDWKHHLRTCKRKLKLIMLEKFL